MIIGVIFLIQMSLMKNKLHRVFKFFVSQLLLNIITSRGLHVIQNLQNLVRVLP